MFFFFEKKEGLEIFKIYLKVFAFEVEKSRGRKDFLSLKSLPNLTLSRD